MKIKGVLAVWLLTICGLSVCGCGKGKNALPESADQNIRWSYSPAGIMLQLAGDEKLNWCDDAPASLALCVYQLAAKLPVADMLRTPDGMEALLECERLDSSVVAARRLFLNPGEQARLPLDREEGVKFVALVAGYHNGTPEGMGVFREIKIPPAPEPGWFSRLWGADPPEIEREPEQLVINLYMAESRILPRPAFVEARE